MSLNNPLADALSMVLNAEKIGKPECKIKPISTVIRQVFKIMQDNHYIGEQKEIEDGRGKHLVVSLIGQINKCGAITPRHSIKHDEFEKFENKYLPARGFGILILSTSQGIMTHEEAKKNSIGGKLIAYCY